MAPRYCRLEYFPPPLIEDRLKTLDQVLEHFVQRGWVSLDSGGVEVRAAGRPWLRFFAVQIQPVLEAYAAFFRVVESLDGSAERRRLLDEAESLLEDELVLGEARYPEAVSRVTFGNALGLLHEESVLICEGALTRAETVFAPGPRWDRLPSLLGRVAATLSSG